MHTVNHTCVRTEKKNFVRHVSSARRRGRISHFIRLVISTTGQKRFTFLIINCIPICVYATRGTPGTITILQQFIFILYFVFQQQQ